MAKKDKFTQEEVIKAVKDANGLLRYAAKTLGCDYSTIWRYAKRNKKVADAIKVEKESLLDLTENKLVNAIKSDKPWAICFYLKTQGKERGYSERHEVTGKDGKDLPPSQPGVLMLDADTTKGALEELKALGQLDKLLSKT
jgi:hypothetical protein